MSINILGNSNSKNSDKKTDLSLSVQKPYLRAIAIYIDANIEEDIDLKNQYRIKKTPDPISKQDACSKNYVDNRFTDPSIIKNTGHVDFMDKDLDNNRFIEVNSFPTIEERLTPRN